MWKCSASLTHSGISGKTSCLKGLKEIACRPVIILSYQDVVDEILHTNSCCREYLLKMNDESSILCVEDVDYLSGREATQECLADMLLQAVKKHLVIITGSSVREKVGILCELCRPDLIRFGSE